MLHCGVVVRTWGLGLLIGSIGACGSGSDLGTCIIRTTGDDIVVENVSLEECQELGLETPGGRGIEWRPNS